MECPQCGVVLKLMEYENTFIHSCEGCGGEFLGPAELTHIVRTREERFPLQLQQLLADRKPEFGVPADEAQRELICPECQNPMQVINYCGDSGVFIDRCPQCGGLWLDHEELEKVQVLLERWKDQAPEQIKTLAGELEKARRTTAEQTSSVFAGSRFAFVNALINRFLDAA